jgi:hypothetical protein
MQLKGRGTREANDARIALGLAIDDLKAAARELAAAGKVRPEAKLFSEETADILTRVKAARDSLPTED